jgi:hypothetical protein
VLSIPLPAEDKSERFKSVVHPSPKVWMHHLEIRDPGQVDEEVARWLRDAYDAASYNPPFPASRPRSFAYMTVATRQ